jgi:hypothetical protein
VLLFAVEFLKFTKRLFCKKQESFFIYFLRRAFMDVNEQNSKKLWKEKYGEKLQVKDMFGNVMIFDNYNKRDAKGAWNIHHIKPIARGGSNEKKNLLIISIDSHDEINGRFPSFKIKGVVYDTVKNRHTGAYEIKVKQKVKQKTKQKEKVKVKNNINNVKKVYKEKNYDPGWRGLDGLDSWDHSNYLT